MLKKNIELQEALSALGEAHIIGSRDNIFKILEKFVCQIYNFDKANNINQARFQKICATYKAKNSAEPFHKT